MRSKRELSLHQTGHVRAIRIGTLFEYFAGPGPRGENGARRLTWVAL